jgi:hypothetical protein
MILDLFRKEIEFNNIQGYDDIKDLVRRALDAEENYNLLFVGPPTSAKTLFLLGILESKKGVTIPDRTPEKGVLRYMRTMNNTPVDMLNTTYRLNSPSVEMTSNVFYFGALHAPQEVRDRKLVLDEGTSNGPLSEAVRPENTLVYVGVTGREVEEGLSYDNHQQAMVIADLCSEFLRHGVDPTRISVMAAYRPHVKTINSPRQVSYAVLFCKPSNRSA